jgi:hypothetical protein
MKFSIRDLFLVTVIVAVCTAWGIDHRRLTNDVRELKAPRLEMSRVQQPIFVGQPIRYLVPDTTPPTPNPKP